MNFLKILKYFFENFKRFLPSVVIIGGTDGPTKIYLNTSAKILSLIILVIISLLIYKISKGGSIIEICKNNRHNT